MLTCQIGLQEVIQNVKYIFKDLKIPYMLVQLSFCRFYVYIIYKLCTAMNSDDFITPFQSFIILQISNFVFQIRSDEILFLVLMSDQIHLSGDLAHAKVCSSRIYKSFTPGRRVLILVAECGRDSFTFYLVTQENILIRKN